MSTSSPDQAGTAAVDFDSIDPQDSAAATA
jgi:hypothetical protein